MIENGTINRFQFFFLVTNFTIGSALLLIPSSVVNNSKNDGWIAMILAIILGAIIQLIIILLACNHPNKTLVQISETLLGKYLGKFIGLLYAWFFLHLSALVVRNLVDFLQIYLIETPVYVFNIMLGILIYFALKYGLEVIGRSNELFSIFVFIGFFLTILLVIPLMNLENLKPILANGFKPIIKGAIPVLGFPYAELIVFMMIVPFVNIKKDIKKLFIFAGVAGGFILFISILSSILVLGEKPTSISLYPTYSIARLINIGEFLTRVEAIISLSYFVIVFVKIIVAIYGSITAFANVFNLKDYRPIILPYIIITMGLSIILNENIIEVITFAATTWTPYAMVFGLIIPLMLLGLTYIKSHQKNSLNKRVL